MMENYENKKVAVIGLARAGIPAARFLPSAARMSSVTTAANWEKLSDEARALESLGVELLTGAHEYPPGLKECALIVLSPGLKIHHSPLREVLESCEKTARKLSANWNWRFAIACSCPSSP